MRIGKSKGIYDTNFVHAEVWMFRKIDTILHFERH